MNVRNTKLLIRYLLVPILLLTLMLSTFTLAQGGTVVRFDAAAAEVAVGETVTVDILVEGVTDLYGVEVHLSFDPAVLEVVDADAGMAGVQVALGSFLPADFVALNEVDQGTGSVDFAYTAMGVTPPSTGNGVLATITFRGVAPGTSALNFSQVLLADADASPISLSTENGQLAVPSAESPTATSEPTAEPTSEPTATPTVTPTPTETPTSGSALLSFDDATVYLTVGETEDVVLRVTGAANLYGIEAHLSHGSGIDATAIQIETCLDDIVAQASVTDNKVDFAASLQSPSDPINGACDLATITLNGLAAGTHSLVFDSALASDPDGSALDLTTQDLAVVVSEEPTATPTETPTATPTSTVTPTVTPSPTSTPSYNCSNILGYHVVRRGETLYSIGRAYAVYPYAIAACNNIINPSLIYPHTSLAIPNYPWIPVPPGPTAQRQFGDGAGTPVCRIYHTVQPGENLFRISLRYGVSMWAIAEANGILNLHYIQAGRTLCIP